MLLMVPSEAAPTLHSANAISSDAVLAMPVEDLLPLAPVVEFLAPASHSADATAHAAMQVRVGTPPAPYP